MCLRERQVAMSTVDTLIDRQMELVGGVCFESICAEEDGVSRGEKQITAGHRKRWLTCRWTKKIAESCANTEEKPSLVSRSYRAKQKNKQRNKQGRKKQAKKQRKKETRAVCFQRVKDSFFPLLLSLLHVVCERHQRNTSQQLSLHILHSKKYTFAYLSSHLFIFLRAVNICIV